MHEIRTTLGFVIGNRNYGESDKLLFIFTEEFGLITVVAQGIRLEKSKLRNYTQDYSLSSFSLVRGKEFWRLTSAASGDSFVLNNSQTLSTASLELIARLAVLLRRLLHGEEANKDIFQCIKSLFKYFESRDDIQNEEYKNLESLIVFRILHILGYVGDDDMFDKDLKSRDLNKDIVLGLTTKRNLINQHINKALRESHL
jgi:DNA repair protein RecO